MDDFSTEKSSFLCLTIANVSPRTMNISPPRNLINYSSFTLLIVQMYIIVNLVIVISINFGNVADNKYLSYKIRLESLMTVSSFRSTIKLLII